MSTVTSTSSATAPSAVLALIVARAFFHLLAALTLAFWGAIEWGFPLPGVFVGLGFFIVCALLWALFLSPRPVLKTDRFGQALVELLLLAGAVSALLSIGVFWVWPTLFGVVAATIGFVTSVPRKAQA